MGGSRSTSSEPLPSRSQPPPPVLLVASARKRARPACARRSALPSRFERSLSLAPPLQLEAKRCGELGTDCIRGAAFRRRDAPTGGGQASWCALLRPPPCPLAPLALPRSCIPASPRHPPLAHFDPGVPDGRFLVLFLLSSCPPFCPPLAIHLPSACPPLAFPLPSCPLALLPPLLSDSCEQIAPCEACRQIVGAYAGEPRSSCSSRDPRATLARRPGRPATVGDPTAEPLRHAPIEDACCH